MSLKQLKIDVKQALEIWEQRWTEIEQWDVRDIPQKKQDDLVDLAMLSGGEIRDALEDLIRYMEDVDNHKYSHDTELVAFREDLATALKETLNYRSQIAAYTREALFAEVGELDALVDVDLLFIDDGTVRESVVENTAAEDDHNDIHDDIED
jgi:hypothetical protein